MTSISEMKHPVVRIVLHDGGTDNWRLGRDCDNYKTTGNALVGHVIEENAVQAF